MTKKFSVHIGWGETPEPGQESMEYAFETEVELEAFLEGVNAADGWMDFAFFDGPQIYTGDGEWMPDDGGESANEN